MSITVVAKRAGVSSSTVSRVINNHPRVAPDTMRNVRKVMAEMGYVPSDRRPGPKPHARPQTATRTVNFLKFSSRKGTTPGLEELLRGVSEAARKHGVTLSLYDLPEANDIPRKILDHPVHGVLLHGALPTLEMHRLLGNVPTVWLMGNRQRPDWGDQVMPDTTQVGRLAALYLSGRGHKHVAFVNMDSGHWPFRISYQSFLATAEEHGIRVSHAHLPWTAKEIYFHHERETIEALADQFAALSPRPTGIFIADDFQAALMQPALIHRGIKFGTLGHGGIEAISCNKEEPFLMGLSPRPATVDIRVESIGRKGLEQLLWRAQHPEFHDRIVTLIEPRLIGADGKIIVDEAAPLPA